MDDMIGKIQVFPDHFQPTTMASPTPSPSNPHSPPNTSSGSRGGNSSNRKKFQSVVSMLNLFTSPRDKSDKVRLSAAEFQSLQLEIAKLEEREAHAKAQLEHVDKLLQSARLSGYLCIRTRWEALPGELPPVEDDMEIDDRLPRFVVLHGACIFFYLLSTDISPQDSCLLSDIIEIAPLPSFLSGGEEMMYSFYILTNHGLRYECSSASSIQVSNWLRALLHEYNQLPKTKTLSAGSFVC